MQKYIKDAHKAGDFQPFHTVRQNGQYVHEVLLCQIVKELQKSVQLNGLHSPFKIISLEPICGTYSMSAYDGGSLMKIILTPAVHAVYAQEFYMLACVTHAMHNFDAAILVSFEQLSGPGHYSQLRQLAQL